MARNSAGAFEDGEFEPDDFERLLPPFEEAFSAEPTGQLADLAS